MFCHIGYIRAYHYYHHYHCHYHYHYYLYMCIYIYIYDYVYIYIYYVYVIYHMGSGILIIRIFIVGVYNPQHSWPATGLRPSAQVQAQPLHRSQTIQLFGKLKLCPCHVDVMTWGFTKKMDGHQLIDITLNNIVNIYTYIIIPYVESYHVYINI